MNPRERISPKPQPTSTDVARAAGVSQATVSYVFNNTPGRPVNPKTRERILEAAQTLGYQPNYSARALRKGHTDEISVLVLEILNRYGTVEWLIGVQQQARKLGYKPVTYFHYGASDETWKQMLDQVLAQHPAGITGSSLGITRSNCLTARKLGVQGRAFLGFDKVNYAPVLVLPFREAGMLAGKHFLDRGHECIGYVSPQPSGNSRQRAFHTRAEGFKSALAPHGIQPIELTMDANLTDARLAVSHFLALAQRPTAIYGFRDSHCFYLLRALQERGIRVPQDVAVVGTDDNEFCDLVYPSLTSIHFDFRQIGSRLVDIIDSMVRGKKPTPEMLIAPAPELIQRESS